jgi:hypothetical protein
LFYNLESSWSLQNCYPFENNQYSCSGTPLALFGIVFWIRREGNWL